MKGITGLLPWILCLTISAAVEAQDNLTWGYNINADGSLTIEGYYGTGGAVTIPINLDAMPVTGVGALSRLSSLTSVVIPDGIMFIADYAFNSCTNLTNVAISASVTNIGALPFYGCSALNYINVDPQNPHYSSVDGVLFDKIGGTLLEYPMGRVGSYTIPSNVTSIGDFAFYECSGLGSVTIPGNIITIGTGAFINCTGLTNAVIENGVASIGDGAFGGCGLVSMTIPASVTNIGATPFSGCRRLKSVTVDAQNPFYSSVNGILFDKGETTLLEYPFGQGGKYAIPAGVTNIADGAFVGCSTLADVTIPGTVTRIGDYAFDECTNLTDVAIPGSVISIGQLAFYSCTGLKNVSIAFGVANIGSMAFSGCSSLIGVTIPASVTALGFDVFTGCSSLATVYFQGNAPDFLYGPEEFGGDNNTTIYYMPGTTGWPSYFGGLPNLPWDQDLLSYRTNANGALTITGYFGPPGDVAIPTNVNGMPVIAVADGAFINSGATSIIIPVGVTSIGDLAFCGLSNLTAINIPGGVTNIGAFAFYGCSSLATVTIPDTVGDIRDGTFYGCTNLAGVVIGAEVASIGKLVFYGCTSLGAITIPSSVTNLGDQAFGYCTNLTNIYFNGNAPSIGSSVFFPDSATVYYLIGKAGWTSAFAGLPVVEEIPYSYVTNSDNTLTITDYYGSDADVIIPSTIEGLTVTGVGAMAVFDSNTSVTNVAIPATVIHVGQVPFFYSMSLRAITVDPQNPFYSSVNGVLFDKLKSTLIEYPMGLTGTYTIPNGVVSVADGGFAGSSITGVVIPASVTNLGNYAFELCSTLTSVYFKGNIPTVGADAFSGMGATIYYLPGTTGWGSSFEGRPAVLWNPLIQIADGSFGVRSNQFGFSITGTTNIPISVEASADLTSQSWISAQILTLTNGSFYFADPQWTNYPSRYYRIGMP